VAPQTEAQVGAPSLVNRPDDEEFYLEMAPGWTNEDVKIGLAVARSHGLEPLPPEECEVELRAGGVARLHLIPRELLSAVA
jgi:hypothetical protein